MSANFDPNGWLDQWALAGGSIQIGAAIVNLVADLSGPQKAQQSLLGKLDSKAGRREEVRDAALARWRR